MSGLSMRQRMAPRRSSASSPGAVSLGAAGRVLAGSSNQSALQQAQPLDLRLSFSQMQAILRESERPLRAWLDENIDYVRGLSARAAAAELVRRVPEARRQGRAYAEGVVRSWAAENNITLRPLSIVPHPADRIPAPSTSSISDSRIVSAVASALRIATEGVVIDRSHGRFQINASGATTELRSGRARIAGRLSWSGELALSSQVGDVHFNASLSAERWQVRLTFPSADMIDLSSLTSIFNEAGNALPRIVSETAGIEGLSEIPDLAERLSPELSAVRRAISTASQIGRMRPGLSFGIQAGGPGLGREQPAGGTPATPQGVSVSGVLTIVF
jgi:hypothetical protein